MRISDLMNADVVTCRDTASLGEAAKLMWEHDIGFLPVTGENGVLAGVITDRDGFIAAYFQGHPIWEIPVKTAMTSRIASVKPEAEVDEAEQMMAEFQVHRLPVVKDGKLVGIISLNDLARHAAGEFDEELEEEVALTLGAVAHPRAPEQAIH